MMSERLLTKVPIEVLQVSTLDNIGKLLKKVNDEKETELQQKTQATDLENAISNIIFVTSEVSPIVRDFFIRRAIRIDFEVERKGLWDKLMGETLEGFTTSTITYSGSEGLWMQIPYDRMRLEEKKDQSKLEREDMSRNVQEKWDSDHSGTVRRMLATFGSFTKEQIVARFGQAISSF